MNLTVLLDNHCISNKNLLTEHGLSFWIEYGEIRLLFDAGETNLAMRNAEALGVDLSVMTHALCSHNHYDHGSGFSHVLKAYTVPNLITGRDFFLPKYRKKENEYIPKSAKIDEELLKEHDVRHIVCMEMYQIANGLTVHSGFDSVSELDAHDDGLYINREGYLRDDFRDEVCLTARTEKGLILLVGCSHPGIINMTKTILKRMDEPIYAIIGGTHLVKANNDEIVLILDELKTLGVEKFGFLHCSGEDALKKIDENYSEMSLEIACGSCLNFC